MNDRGEVRVLVVEDEYLVSEMIQGTLEELGYAVIGEATNGHQAVHMAQALQPDVVLMDIRIPEMNGIEATHRIQEQCPTPVVVLTSHETAELVEDASQAGVGAYLVKPPNARELERAITIAMARFRDMVELRQLNEDLEARNEELDAFTHIVAHDLQNPLANIIGFAEVLQKHHTSIPHDELDDYLGTIERIGRKMSDTIEQLLLLAKAYHVDVEMMPLDMGFIVAEALKRLTYMIEKHQADITLPRTWPTALGHGPWVEEVWLNYLSNAIKYGGDPPHIHLGAELESDDMIAFWVQDDGSGIKEEDQDRLFAPFPQLNQSPSTTSRGHGLGLSIVKRIVDRLGGGTKVESGGQQGSRFIFTLPAAQEQGAQHETA
ncbi:MAG: response regulator [Anaerolineae bacterium]|jgi:signal transduction histidine kinase